MKRGQSCYTCCGVGGVQWLCHAVTGKLQFGDKFAVHRTRVSLIIFLLRHTL